MPDWLPRTIVAPVGDAEHEAVRTAQRALRVPETGDMDAPTKTALRGIQALLRLPITGVLDQPTAVALDRLRPSALRD